MFLFGEAAPKGGHGYFKATTPLAGFCGKAILPCFLGASLNSFCFKFEWKWARVQIMHFCMCIWLGCTRVEVGVLIGADSEVLPRRKPVPLQQR